MTELYVFGSGGHASVILDIIRECGGYEPVFVVESIPLERLGKFKYILVSNFVSDNLIEAVIAIGNNNIRKNVASNYQNLNWRILRHPNSIISPSAQISIGSVVMPGVVIQAGVIIGSHCIINTSSSIDHDCKLGDFVHISPGVALAGNVNIGERSHLGIGSCVIPGVRIGNCVTVGAGAVVIDDVPDYAVVVGNPGKVIKYNYER